MKSIKQSNGVFILSPRSTQDRDLEDQHTILRSWAVKDYAPDVPQYVQLFRPENKIHLEFVGALIFVKSFNLRREFFNFLIFLRSYCL